jgi:hypothetical protein
MFQLGRVDEAEALYREALAIAVQVGRATTIARTRRGLAEILLQRGDVAGAGEHLREAVPIYSRLGMREEVQALQPLLARVGAGQLTSSV